MINNLTLSAALVHLLSSKQLQSLVLVPVKCLKVCFLSTCRRIPDAFRSVIRLRVGTQRGRRHTQRLQCTFHQVFLQNVAGDPTRPLMWFSCPYWMSAAPQQRLEQPNASMAPQGPNVGPWSIPRAVNPHVAGPRWPDREVRGTYHRRFINTCVRHFSLLNILGAWNVLLNLQPMWLVNESLSNQQQPSYQWWMR